MFATFFELCTFIYFSFELCGTRPPPNQLPEQFQFYAHLLGFHQARVDTDEKSIFQNGCFRVPKTGCFLFILAIDWLITGRISASIMRHFGPSMWRMAAQKDAPYTPYLLLDECANTARVSVEHGANYTLPWIPRLGIMSPSR